MSNTKTARPTHPSSDARDTAHSKYANTLAALRLSRREHFAELIEIVTATDWDLDALETRLEDLRKRFNRARPAGQIRYQLRWHPSRRARSGLVHHGAGLAISSNDAARPRRFRRLTAWPKSREIDRRTHPLDCSYRQDVLQEIKLLNKAFLRDRLWLYKLGNIARDIAVEHKLSAHPIDVRKAEVSFESACHHRAASLAYVVRVIKALLERMEKNDRELLKAMHEFNTVEPKRRNGSLSVAFSIRDTQREQRVGPTGPFVSTVSFNNARRYTHRLKTNSKRFPNRVTRDVIRSRHLRRYARPLLLLGRQIEQLRNKRDACQDAAERLYRHIRTMQRVLL